MEKIQKQKIPRIAEFRQKPEPGGDQTPLRRSTNDYPNPQAPADPLGRGAVAGQLLVAPLGPREGRPLELERGRPDRHERRRPRRALPSG